MDRHQIAWSERASKEILQNLRRRRFEASYAATVEQARDEVLAMIPQGATVYRCGSMTTTSMGLWDKVAELPGVTLIDPSRPGISTAEATELRRQGLLADVMIASSNAITLDGRLVNLDAVGNRVAAMSFGPKKVILVIGMNKVAPDLDSAIARVKHFAAPVNAQRVGYKVPCGETGLCSDCGSSHRLCNQWSIMEGQWEMFANRIHVKLVGEALGF